MFKLIHVAQKYRVYKYLQWICHWILNWCHLLQRRFYQFLIQNWHWIQYMIIFVWAITYLSGSDDYHQFFILINAAKVTKGIMNKGIIFRPPFTSLDGINFIHFLSLYFPRLRSEMISYMNHFENYLVLLAIGTNIQANWTNRVKPWNPKI